MSPAFLGVRGKRVLDHFCIDIVKPYSDVRPSQQLPTSFMNKHLSVDKVLFIFKKTFIFYWRIVD